MSQITVNVEGNLVIRCPYEEKDKIKTIGGKWDKIAKCWLLPFTVGNVNFVLDNLSDPIISDAVEKRLQDQIQREERLTKIKKMAKIDKPIQFKIAGVKLPLYNYQKLGVLYALTNPSGILLADEMGLGKCSSWNTSCYSRNGKITIKKIWENHINQEKTNTTPEGGEWFTTIPDKPVDVLSQIGGKLAFQRVKGLYRERANKLATLKLRDSSEVEVGLNHGYLTQYGWKHAKDIQPKKDWIAVASKIDIPNGEKLNEDLVEFMAWHIGEGFDGRANGFSITQGEVSVLEKLEQQFLSFGFKNNGRKHDKPHIEKDKRNDCNCLKICSSDFNQYLKQEFGYEHGYRSGNKIIPERIQNCHLEGVRKFLRAYWDAEGCCNESNLELTSKSKKVIESLRYMMRRFGVLGITSEKKARTKKGMETYWTIFVGGKYARLFKQEIGFGYQYKQEALEKLCRKKCNTNIGDSVPCRELLQELLGLTQLSFRRIGLDSRVYTSLKTTAQNPSKSLVRNIIVKIDDMLSNGLELVDNPKWANRRRLSIDLLKQNRNRIIEIRNQLEFLASEDLTWLEVDSMEIKGCDEWLYDLEMEGEPNYVLDLAISHNTLQAIATACYKKYKEGIKKCLIITPASLKWNWPLEIEKFTNEPYVVIDGPPEERVRQWQRDDVFFYVVNYELVLEDLFGGREYRIDEDNDDAFKIAQKNKLKKKATIRAERLEDIRNRVWDMIAVDEIHYMKSHASKRSKNVKMLKAKYRIGLTGTPLDGRLEELHSVMEFVQPGLFESKTAFLQKHAIYDFWGRIKSYKKIGEVRDRIQPFFLRRLKKDVLKELPDKIYQNRYVLLSTEEIRTYKDIANRAHEVTEDAQAMVAVIRAKQFCDYPELIGITTKTNSKLEEFKSIIKEVVIDNAHKVIVFSQYAKMCEILIKEIQALGLKHLYICGDTDQKRRADMQAEFNNDPNIDIIVGTDAMSCGLNLVGADYVINYDDFWSPSVMAQREDRAHRNGQKNAVTVINFICRDTIEERIRDVLYNKATVSAEVLGDATEETILRRLNPKDLAKLL